MKRGEKEKEALNKIRKFLFCGMLSIPYKCDGKTAYECSVEEFKNNYFKYINNKGNFYGFDNDDFVEILNAIRTAKENTNLSEFPDFLLEDGYIEHFQITASRENRKGSAEKIDVSIFKKKINNEVNEFYKYCNEKPSYNQVRSKRWIRNNLPEYSYENLVFSFKSNFEKHLKSLEKYKGEKDLSIFLIENEEVNLEMYENSYKDMENLRCDYPQRQEHVIRYMLSRDKNMLNYIYNFKDKIKYIIYFYEENFEVIKVENIPELFKDLRNEYIILPRKIYGTYVVANLSKPFSLRSDNEQE